MNAVKPNNKNFIDKYVMHLSNDMVEGIISKIQIEIEKQKIAQCELQPILDIVQLELEIAQSAYNEVQNKYDAYQAIVDREEATLRAMVAFKTNKSVDKAIVYKHMDNNKAGKIRQRGVYRPWQKVLNTTLLREKRFLKPSELIKICIANNPDWTVPADELKKLPLYIFYRVKTGRYKGVIQKEGHIGLEHWMLNANDIKPEYLKLGMFNEVGD